MLVDPTTPTAIRARFAFPPWLAVSPAFGALQSALSDLSPVPSRALPPPACVLRRVLAAREHTSATPPTSCF